MNNYIDLNIRELIDNCSEDNRFLDNMDSIKQSYNKKIHNLTSYTPFNCYHFMHNIRLYENGSITLEENDLLDVICKMFGISKRNFKDEDELIKFLNTNIKYLKGNLKDNYCIIPIKKGEWSHFVILNSIDENQVNLVDNKKWEFSVSIPEFEDLMNLENWKYVLFANKQWLKNFD